MAIAHVVRGTPSTPILRPLKAETALLVIVSTVLLGVN
jgi:hypothetical protein